MARKTAAQSVSRDEIILAAADVLQRNGYEAATMKDIAAHVNLTAASLYHHFRNKDALVLAVLEFGLEHAIARLEPLLDSDLPSREKLRRMIHVHVVLVARHTPVGAAMVFEIRRLRNVKPPREQAAASDQEAYHDFVTRREAFFARRAHFENLFVRVLREGVAARAFCPVDVEIFSKTLLGAHNWVGIWFRDDGRLSGEQVAGMMADTFLRALRPDDSHKNGSR